ncbi:hypothetical protein [Roseofilum sp. Guam]|uniref:hypothetical protein n=1 Tax=Roseofilum sp. Guam TaxID=2821502 RepID=UPI001B06F3BF|nr:hypothetical protein [Roseofilum sp. Guam]MBP0029026.1 hypothetical protein [Roseofilum sp. Guam]
MSPEDENFICTTSRNRVLFKSKHAELLNQLFTDSCVPMAVVTEIMSAETSDLAKQNLPEKNWLRPVDQSIAPIIQSWDLGAGESTVLSFAFDLVNLLKDKAGE